MMNNLTDKDIASILKTLKERFEKNSSRHTGIEWDSVCSKLASRIDKLNSLFDMESTGGEPDVTGFDTDSGEFIFMDCSPETPAGRRSICYDREALDSRKEFKPLTSAVDMAAKMGVEILTEDEYRDLQKLGSFDNKTSSWIKTPPEMRVLGGALFGDCRYGRVFVYHNGAQSYYSGRGFRGKLKV